MSWFESPGKQTLIQGSVDQGIYSGVQLGQRVWEEGKEVEGGGRLERPRLLRPLKGF